MVRRWMAGCAAVVALALAGCGQSAAASDDLVFASIPSEDSTSLQQQYQPLLAMLEKQTGRKITFRKATDYAAIIEGQRSGKIDIALYGPLSYVLARNTGVKITPLAAQVKEKGQRPGYRSYGLVKAGSPITSLAGFRGKKVCFVDLNSTSGYLYPRAALTKAGVDPVTGITPVMAGGHDAAALAVKTGQCAAGFAYDLMVDHVLVEKGQLKRGELRIVWKSDEIPGSPIAMSDDLDPAVKAKLTSAFASMANADYLRAHGYCKGVCTLDGFWGFQPVTDAFFGSVREVCRLTQDKQCKPNT